MVEENVKKCVACGETIQYDLTIYEEEKEFPHDLYKTLTGTNKANRVPPKFAIGFFSNDDVLKYVIKNRSSKCKCIIQ